MGDLQLGSVEFVAVQGKDVSPPFELVRQEELVVFAHVQDEVRDEWWELVYGLGGEAGHLRTSGSYPMVSIRLATSNPQLPLFVFSYPDFEQAMYSQTKVSHQVLIDFRNYGHKILASLQCSFTEGAGGNCSPYDSPYYRRTELRCDWNAGIGDFSCIQFDVMPLGWGERRAARRFLLGREPLPSPDPAPRTHRQADRSTPVKSTNPGVLGELNLEGVGPLRAVFTGFLSKSRGVFTIYVGQGSSAAFDARFFVVALWPEREQIIEFVPRRPRIDGTLFDSDPLRGQPDGPTPDASVAALPTADPGLHILRAVVTDQYVRGAYLLGLEESNTGLVVDTFLLATEAAYYVRCRQYIVPENSIAVEFHQNPFTAALWLEPSFRVEAVAGDLSSIRTGKTYETITPTPATLCWQTGNGFRIEPEGPIQANGGPPLFVVLSEDGQIGSLQAVR